MMYALVKMSQSDVATPPPPLPRTPPSPPLPPPTSAPPPSAPPPTAHDAPTSLVEHYSTVRDAVDLTSRIYDEPPNGNPENRYSDDSRRSCQSCNADLYYQPVETSPSLQPRVDPVDANASSRRHQYDFVYIPAACEHAMQRRLDAGGYVKCRRALASTNAVANNAGLDRLDHRPDHRPDQRPDHRPDQRPDQRGDNEMYRDEELEEQGLLQNAYEHLEYGDYPPRPVLPRRRESLPHTAAARRGPPQLPPRVRQPDRRDSNLYECVDLTYGCPMLRPLSASAPAATEEPLAATTVVLAAVSAIITNGDPTSLTTVEEEEINDNRSNRI